MTNDEFIQETARLKEYFATAVLPKGRIQINSYYTSSDLQYTVDSFFLKLDNGRVFEGVISELQVIEQFLKEKNV